MTRFWNSTAGDLVTLYHQRWEIVKRAISKYNARGPSIDRTTYKATTAIEIITAPLTPSDGP